MDDQVNPSQRIDRYIAEIEDWRGRTLAGLRKIILETDPEIVEEWKWMGSPVWERDGIIAVGNAHKSKVKLTFMYGARLPDPKGLFNANDKGGTRRAIDLHEGDEIDVGALQDLVRAAIGYNRANRKATGSKRA